MKFQPEADLASPQFARPLPRPKIVRAGEGEPLELSGGPVHFLLIGQETGGRILLYQSEDSPGAEPLLHIHEREDELFIVESGCYEFVLGIEHVSAGPGTIIFAPRGMPHAYRVISDEPGRLISACLPANFGQAQNLLALAPEEVVSHCSPRQRHALIIVPPSRYLTGYSERSLLSAHDSGGALNLVEWQMPAGSCPVLNNERCEDTIFLVREGCWEFEMDGQQVQVEAGSTVFIPCPHPHSFRVIGADRGRMLLISYPPLDTN